MDWTPEQQTFRDQLRQFLEQELAPITPRIDREGYYPMDAVKKMAAWGLLGLVVPTQYGGRGFDAVTYTIALEEIARVCGSTCLSVSAHNSLCCAPIVAFGTEAQKQRYLPPLAQGQILGAFGVTEPVSGSDVRSMKSTAVRQGDRYLLTGAKRFTTNGGLAQVYVIGAHTIVDGEQKGVSTFLVEAGQQGFIVTKPEEKLGVRGSHTTGLFFDEVEVPSGNLLGKEGRGFEQLMATIEAGRIGLGAMAVGIAQAAFDVSLAYAWRRIQSGESIEQHQAVQWALADMATEVEAARLLVRQAAWAKDHGRRFRKAASMAKLFASEMSGRVTAAAIQMLGIEGCLTTSPVERYYRDARLTEIGEGTSEIQRIIVARELIKELDAQAESPGERLLRAME